MQIFVSKLKLYPVGYNSSLALERGSSSMAISRPKRRLSSTSSPMIRVMGHRVTPHQSVHGKAYSDTLRWTGISGTRLWNRKWLYQPLGHTCTGPSLVNGTSNPKPSHVAQRRSHCGILTNFFFLIVTNSRGLNGLLNWVEWQLNGFLLVGGLQGLMQCSAHSYGSGKTFWWFMSPQKPRNSFSTSFWVHGHK